jgi:hypothetical protein
VFWRVGPTTKRDFLHTACTSAVNPLVQYTSFLCVGSILGRDAASLLLHRPSESTVGEAPNIYHIHDLCQHLDATTASELPDIWV